MTLLQTILNFDDAIDYHYDAFPPASLDYQRLIHPLAKAMDTIGRFDEALKKIHNNRLLLAPLRSQEAVISSRMEGTVSTLDEILSYEAERENDEEENQNVRDETRESWAYQYEEIKPIFKEILSPRWYIEALDYIFANPIYLNRKFIENSNIPPQVATRTTRKLLEAGWLMTVSEPAGRRSGIYAFEPLLKLVRV